MTAMSSPKPDFLTRREIATLVTRRYRDWIGGEGESIEKRMVDAVEEDEHIELVLDSIPPEVTDETLNENRWLWPMVAWAKIRWIDDPNKPGEKVPDAALTGNAVVLALVDGKLSVLTLERSAIQPPTPEGEPKPEAQKVLCEPAGFTDSDYLPPLFARPEIAQPEDDIDPDPETQALTARRETIEEVGVNLPLISRDGRVLRGSSVDGEGRTSAAPSDERRPSHLNRLVYMGTYGAPGRDPRTVAPWHEYHEGRIESEVFVAVLSSDGREQALEQMREFLSHQTGPYIDPASVGFTPVEDVLVRRVPLWADFGELVADSIGPGGAIVKAERDAKALDPQNPDLSEHSDAELAVLQSEFERVLPLAQLASRNTATVQPDLAAALSPKPDREARVMVRRPRQRLDLSPRPPATAENEVTAHRADRAASPSLLSQFYPDASSGMYDIDRRAEREEPTQPSQVLGQPNDGPALDGLS